MINLMTSQVKEMSAPIPSPVFIVGAPRSGTKLLRALLNNHHDVSLGGEGNFIPRFINHFGLAADLSQPQLQEKIYSTFSRSVFYSGLAQRGIAFPDKSVFMDTLASYKSLTWADVFEVMIRNYGPNPQARIYGDKSHGYISSADLLRTIFPQVRFIFLVRDPRDQALSAADIWGRHPLRSAQLWASVARAAAKAGLDANSDALTVRYEDLTSGPEDELKRICTFLHLEYMPEMHLLQNPAERERKGRQLKTVTKQHAKYRDRLSPKTVKSISEITLPYLAKYGYPDEGATKQRELSRTERRLLSYRDGLASLRFHMGEKGIQKGATYYLKRRYEAFAGSRQQLE